MEARGWGPHEISAALERMVKVRNIATHGADAVLLDLGYPADAVRKMRYDEALGTEFAAGSIQSDLPALVQVVGRTLDRTIRDLASDGWEDKATCPTSCNWRSGAALGAGRAPRHWGSGPLVGTMAARMLRPRAGMP